MRFSPLDRALGFVRRAALEDLEVTLPSACIAARVLRLTSRDAGEREAAESACQALHYALMMIRHPPPMPCEAAPEADDPSPPGDTP